MRIAAFAALTVLATSAVAAEPVSKPVAFHTWARVSLDAAGQPTSIEPSPELPEAVREYLRARVAQWHFSPPMRDGKTGSAVTFVRLGACALPEPGGGYRLGVDLKGNGPRYASAGIMVPPIYPRSDMRRGREASMRVSYLVEPDGSTRFERVEFTDGRPHRDDSFEDAARDWVEQMHYEPEVLAGQPVRTRVEVPVTFTLGAPSRHSRAASVLASEECQLAAGAAPAGLQPLAMDSPVQVEPRS